MSETTFIVERAKSGRSTCKRSKQKIPKDAIRLGKQVPNPHGDPDSGDMMVQWFLPGPFFEMMRAARKTTKKLESVDELVGFDSLDDDSQSTLRQQVADFWDATVTVTKAPAKKRPKKDEADEEEAEAKPKKPKATPKKKKEPRPSVVVPCETPAAVKGLVPTLLEKCALPENRIDVPTDEAEARQSVGAVLIAQWDRDASTVDLGKCLDELDKKHGNSKWQDDLVVNNAANRALAIAFKELASFAFKSGDTFKGTSNTKVHKALCEAEEVIDSAKKAIKLEGVGKSSGAKIEEFIETGTFQALEDARSGKV